MEAIFKPPEPLQLDGNISENWRKFSQRFNLFIKATGLSAKPEEKQLAVLLNLIGDDALELYNTFTFGENEHNVATVKQKFMDYCSPKKNVIFERFKFNSIIQQEGQHFDAFVTDLRKAVKTTEYADQDDMIRDKIVMGIHSKTTQEKLLRESDLTLTKAINICRAIEISKDQSKILQNEAVVHEIKRVTQKNICNFCGYSHSWQRCPARGKTCAKCQGRNHFANVCKKQTKEEEKSNKSDNVPSCSYTKEKNSKVKKKIPTLQELKAVISKVITTIVNMSFM